jgi:hypothetical protein
MPTRKRRRRRQKLQRHEYEYVVETDEGEEVVESLRELEDGDEAERPAKGDAKRSSGKPRRRGAPTGPVDRRGRPMQKPTLTRAAKRGVIFMPFFVLFFFIAAPDLTTNQKIFQAVFLAALFIPASYLADRLVYRIALRRSGGGGTGQRR